MPEEVKEQVQEFKPVPGFPNRRCEPVKCDDPYMIELKVKFDPKTGSTTPDESNKVNLVEIIQTYRDQCGMELAKKMIKLGQADPAQFRDDGNHSYDASVIPETTQQRANAAIVAEKRVEALATEMGIPNSKISDDQLTYLIQQYISAHQDKFVKPAETPKEAQ
jgi:hypothetical protein